MDATWMRVAVAHDAAATHLEHTLSLSLSLTMVATDAAAVRVPIYRHCITLLHTYDAALDQVSSGVTNNTH